VGAVFLSSQQQRTLIFCCALSTIIVTLSDAVNGFPIWDKVELKV
jgi:hypothetical protein